MGVLLIYPLLNKYGLLHENEVNLKYASNKRPRIFLRDNVSMNISQNNERFLQFSLYNVPTFSIYCICRYSISILDCLTQSFLMLPVIFQENCTPVLSEDVHHPSLAITLNLIFLQNKTITKNNTDFIFRKANFPELYNSILTKKQRFLEEIDDVNVL